MRNEVTVSACQHLASVALAKQSFPYVLAGSVIARSLTVCVWTKKHGMTLVITGNASVFINSQLTGKSAACMNGRLNLRTRRKFYVVNDPLRKEVERGKKMDLVKAA